MPNELYGVCAAAGSWVICLVGCGDRRCIQTTTAVGNTRRTARWIASLSTAPHARTHAFRHFLLTLLAVARICHFQPATTSSTVAVCVSAPYVPTSEGLLAPAITASRHLQLPVPVRRGDSGRSETQPRRTCVRVRVYNCARALGNFIFHFFVVGAIDRSGAIASYSIRN